MAYRYQFFDGLSADSLETVIEEYQNAGVGWRVHTLFVREQNTTDSLGPSSSTVYDVLLERQAD
jgi:hypothetical protein